MKTKLVNCLAIILLITSPLLSPMKASATYDSGTTQNYLSAHQGNPWVTMALVSSGATSISSDYLKNISGTSAVEYEAPILAITALGEDPHSFGSSDYVADMKSYSSNGQLGDPSVLNDDLFGLLALVASGEPTSDPTIQQEKDYILSQQGTDGGWAYVVGGESDSNMTAVAIASLISSGVTASDSRVQKALDFLKTTQNDDGGFGYSHGSSSDSSSTSWVMWALIASGINPNAWARSGNTPAGYLESNQSAAGYFKFQGSSSEDAFSPVTTAYAAIALTNKTLPLRVVSSNISPTQTFPFRIEGSSQTVCQGSAPGPTALDLVKNASEQCGFTYNIKSGNYLNKINADEASGMTGWMYFVNNSSPDVGAADYQLQTNDEVLWYFGDWGWQPTRLTLSSTEVSSGQSITVTAEYFDNGSYKPLADADIYYGAASAKTDGSGQAALNPQDGYYKIYAQKTKFVRSNTQTLKVGQPESSNVSLSATVGEVKGEATTSPDVIAFTVSPSNLDFGTINSGSSTQKSLIVHNTGTVNIKIMAQISGDSLFTDYLTLSSNPWRSFGLDLSKDSSQDIAAKLNIPAGLKLTSGQKTGSIVFWANPD